MHIRNFKHEHPRHRNLICFPTGPVCEICGKVFTQLRNLKQHQRTIHEKSVLFSCTHCDYTTSRKSNLDRHHFKRHTSLGPNSLPKVARREPDSSTNHHLFHQNTQQRGFGLSPTDVPDEVRQFFHDEQPWGTDPNLRQIYVRNFHRIRDTETINRRSKIFLCYLNHSNSPLIESIARVLKDIFLRQTNAFKINMSFSFILQHRETGEFRYHYASNNDQLLNSPCLIRNQHDLDTLLDFLTSQDFPSHLKDQRPNTKWVIERIVSLRIHLVMTSYPLGNPPNLPDYIKNNRYVIALEKDEHHAYRYKDHLCFFRCLAIAKFGKTRHNCNLKAKELFDQYCEHFGVNPQDFKGVELIDFPQLETFYETQLFVMFLKEDGSAKTIFHKPRFPPRFILTFMKII